MCSKLKFKSNSVGVILFLSYSYPFCHSSFNSGYLRMPQLLPVPFPSVFVINTKYLCCLLARFFPLGFKAIRLQLFQSLFIRFPFARFPFRVYFGSLLKLWCCFRHFNYNTPNKSEAAFVIESHAPLGPPTDSKSRHCHNWHAINSTSTPSTISHVSQARS